MRLHNFTDDELAESAAYHHRHGHLLTAGIMHELIDRRAEAASEHRKLERSMAYEHAAGLIEGCCTPANYEATDWFDLDDFAEFTAEDVSDADRYLDLRGLIQRDATNPNHIAIRDESEAAA